SSSSVSGAPAGARDVLSPRSLPSLPITASETVTGRGNGSVSLLLRSQLGSDASSTSDAPSKGEGAAESEDEKVLLMGCAAALGGCSPTDGDSKGRGAGRGFGPWGRASALSLCSALRIHSGSAALSTSERAEKPPVACSKGAG